ncbi:hypothetical protein ABZ622_30995 [Streptomyces sp. NPDC007164]|uniref:hypothetical protein n=1 Tax=Streptomyces sp. NPDC007164 TaxID=3156918 RepID=UPI0033CA44C1
MVTALQPADSACFHAAVTISCPRSARPRSARPRSARPRSARPRSARPRSARPAPGASE